MSMKQMLYALTRVNMALSRAAPPAGEELQELRTLVAEALSSGAQTLQRSGRPRNPANARGTSGRPPSVRYRIDVDNYEPRIVTGGQAAADAVNEHLAEFGMRQRVTQNTLIAGIARSGAWIKLCDHSNGTSVISVARLPDEEKSA